MFQSSPVTKDGRYASEMADFQNALGFNPRPSLRTGATVYRCGYGLHDVFQSSPVTKDGRYFGCWERNGLTGFNPRPSLRTGAPQTFQATVQLQFQSSPVTKDGRYAGHALCFIEFQSSPVTKDGRYGRAYCQRSFSILARH